MTAASVTPLGARPQSGLAPRYVTDAFFVNPNVGKNSCR